MRSEIHQFREALRQRGIAPKKRSDAGLGNQPTGAFDDMNYLSSFSENFKVEDPKKLFGQKDSIAYDNKLQSNKHETIYLCSMMGLGGINKKDEQELSLQGEAGPS
eukprot:Pgem_evm1s5702